MEFNVGDYIRIKKEASSYYSYSKYKSTGTVKEVGEDDILICFDYLSGRFGETMLDNANWWIEKRHCKIIKKPSQQDKVCAKIKQMETRWLAFQNMKRLQAKKGTCHV